MKRVFVLILLVVSLLVGAPSVLLAQSGTFADPAFEAVWNRTDAAVKNLQSNRSWLWGPQPLNAGIREPYAESPNGTRLVQYFDKARMEITYPGYNEHTLWYVTNGLLPIELITGQMQIGNAQFEQRQPSTIPVIGDLDNPFPTYADLAPVFARQGTGARVGDPVTSFLSRDGTIGYYDIYRNDPATHLAVMDINTMHGIPAAFLTYMQEQSDALGRVFVFGHPVSAPYWVIAKVGQHEQPVMFQVFERRVLTYTPNNPKAFQVESGNVGQHYLLWRYPPPKVEVSPPQGPLGTTFIVRVIGLPAGEQASIYLGAPPYGGGITAPTTIVGGTEPVTFELRTTDQTSVGTWVISVTRSTSSVSYAIATFDVTAP